MYHKLITAGVAVLLVFLAHQAHGKSLPTPLEEGQFASAKACGRCHTSIYSKWKDSMHAQATSDPIFRTSYMEAYLESRGKVKDLCLNCHAPTASITGNMGLDDPITSEGVTCHFCHSIEGVDLEKKKNRFRTKVGKTVFGPRNKNKGKTPYHNSVESTIHRKSELCAGCHEYKNNGITILGTYSEWKNGPYASKGIQCQNCHMPLIEARDSKGKKKRILSHYLAGGHSVTQLKKALTLKIAGIKRGKDRITVEVEVENSGSGHMIPTGIPTRRLRLTVIIKTSDGRTMKKAITYEKVIFDDKGRELTRDADIMLGLGTQIVKDNRVAPGEKRKERLVFYTDPSVELSVSATVDYLYEPNLIQPAEMKIEMSHIEKFFGREQ